jgi:hypothetical protein
MSKLAEDVIDLAVRLRGSRTPEDAARAAPTILAGLRRAADRVRRLPRLKRRQPDVEEAAGWLWRAAHEVGVDLEQRGELDVTVCELVKLVGTIELVG